VARGFTSTILGSYSHRESKIWRERQFVKIRFENGGKPDVSMVLPLRRVLTATQKLGVTLPIF